MRQIKLIIQYDGTNYCGWQIQPNGITIQQVLEEAYSRMLDEPVRLTSSGRTDAGVHARGMVATFQTEKQLPLQAFVAGINTMIPTDIAVLSAEEVPEGFNPRREALGKHYRYTILRSPVRSPLDRLYAWHYNRNLDLVSMREAAGHFVGERDFSAFRGSNCAAKTTVRTIHSLEVVASGEFLHIDVKGTGFLKNMVRIIAGTLVEVGQGKIAAADVPLLFTCARRHDAGMTAPAKGLCLVEVYY